MLNSCALVGKIIKKPEILPNVRKNPKTLMLLETDRPFLNVDGVLETDVFEIELWRGIAQQCADLCEEGDIIGLRGRLYSYQDENGEYRCRVIAETVTFIEKRILANHERQQVRLERQKRKKENKHMS